MQLKMVVLPAPLGPIRPTISNSSTVMLTSRRAWTPPKRIETSWVSRTGIAGSFRSGPPASVERERLTFEPPADGGGDGAEAVGLEDQRQDGQDPAQGGDVIAGVVLEGMDAQVLGQVRQVFRRQLVEQGEEDDAAPAAQPAHHGDDQVRQGDAGE